VKSIRRSSGSAVRFALITVLLLCAVPPVQGAPAKLRVNDLRAAERLIAKGGRVLADYGSFQLIEVEEAAAASAQAEGAEAAEESHFIPATRFGWGVSTTR